MSMKIGGYWKASTVAEAASIAKAHPGKSEFLAAGTDVLVKARADDRYENVCIIDLSSLEELKEIRETADSVEIGALVTHGQISASPLIRQYCQLLASACITVGSPQIRNRGTIGGNIANASPAADSLPALAALHAKVELVDGNGETACLGLCDIISAPYKRAIPGDMVITKIIVPKHEGYRSEYCKLGRRNSLSISRMTIAAVAKVAEDGRVQDFSLAVGSVFPKPYVMEELNAELMGKIPTPEQIGDFAARTAGKIPEIAGIRSTTKYKQPVCENLTRRVALKVLRGE